MARSDLDRFAKALADAGRDLRAHRDPMREPLARSDFAGSSLNFEIFLRRERPDLVVPERECVLITGIGFEPEQTWRDEGPCPKCGRVAGGERESGPDRSRMVCAHCLQSEYDYELAAQRQLAGLPPAEKPTPSPAQRRKDRRRMLTAV